MVEIHPFESKNTFSDWNLVKIDRIEYRKKSMLRINDVPDIASEYIEKETRSETGKIEHVEKKEDIYNRIDWKETKKALVNARTCSKTKNMCVKL